MKKCPGCGAAPALNAVEDAEGRLWHRECLERHGTAPMTAQPARPVAKRRHEQDRLEQERDLLRDMIAEAKKHQPQ